jgi:hypothetical protein
MHNHSGSIDDNSGVSDPNYPDPNDPDPDADPEMVESTTHQPNQAEGDDDSGIGDVRQ